MSFNQLHTQSTSPMDANGVVRCSHGETATRKTSQTSANPNRDFYTCARVITSERCRFFYWVDDPIFLRQQNIPVSPLAPAPSMSFPSQRQRAEAARGLATPQRQRAESSRGLATPQKSPRKRLADIEAALREAPGPQVPPMSQHNSSQRNETATDGITHSFLFGDGSEHSQASTNVDWDHELPEEVEPSGRDYSGSPTSPDYSVGGLDPRTPKKPKTSPVEPSAQALPLTPPQTNRRRTGTSSGQDTFQADFPSTPTRHKGKERENLGGEKTTAGANASVPGPSRSGSSGSGSNTLQRTPSNPFITENTTGENIAWHLESLISLSPAPYVLKLERKVNALERSLQAKAKYLEDLKAAKAESESETTRLTEENAGLERANERLRQENADLQQRLRQSEQSSRIKDIEIAAIKTRRPPNI
ncbi:hypothetical protein DFH29DRAFT_927341 [Suillus ampliporus]|nr:hypothetical protein DFH29DRAFT_927341 [Suillus ampliporus]